MSDPTPFPPRSANAAGPPRTIRMHERDNVAIVANAGGLAAGTALPSGPVLRERVPQGHKVALAAIAAEVMVVSLGCEKLKGKGLTFAATPASDFICGTLQLAAGKNLHVFTTGRGTPYGPAAVPVIKVASRSELARRWHDLMDVNAGRIADGTATIEEVGRDLFRLMLDVAGGRKKTRAEHWKLHNALVLFNPAPVT